MENLLDCHMKNYTDIQRLDADEEIDVLDIFKAVWRNKLLIIIISFFFSVVSIVFAISQPNMYKSSTLLAPVSSQGGASGLAGLASQFGGLASIAGINLGSSSGDDKTALALEIIKSRKFIQSFIEKYNLLIPLMATEGWDIHKNELLYDPELYSLNSDEWVRDVSFPKKSKPSLWEGYKEFLELLSVSQDKNSSMVTIAIEHFSPYVAHEWLGLLVKEINETIKNQEQLEAQTSIEYLNQQLEETSVANMQAVFYQLIEEQTKTMMLTKVSSEYVFKTIDPANIPEEKSKPRRAMIVILGTLLGILLGIFIAIARSFSKTSNN